MIRTVSGAAYLETLNPEQRRAVEHGVGGKDCTPGMPLLVIAGAGSGKTNSIAWTAHFLADLHAKNEKLFSTIIVISDRNVIDAQLQDALFDKGIFIDDSFNNASSIFQALQRKQAGQQKPNVKVEPRTVTA